LQDLRRRYYQRNSNVRIGLGFIRSYTGVKNARDYSASASFPIISIGYDVPYRQQIRVGVQVAFGPHRFSSQNYSDYESTQTDIVLKERIFTVHAYGKYSFAYSFAAFQPYIIGGIGINTSRINTEQDIKFINNANHTVLVKSGTNAAGIGIMARIGTDYFINNNLRVFGDIGVGATILSLGITATIN
jgi:hypothetical protein